MYILKTIKNHQSKIKNLLTAFLVQQPQSTFQLPLGEPVTYQRLTNLLDSTAKFLYTAGITLAVITLVISGIMYFWAKSDTEAKSAKGWLRNGIIGVFIILATGVIIQTIKIIVEGGFFGGSRPSVTTEESFQNCTGPQSCPSGFTCFIPEGESMGFCIGPGQ
ncbi:MAG: hypothetical protein G01um10142_22 [Parcubacteria group bacterium Gr01-1014_2]|nr:MAG: hypothetical protein G01um10142_22 [Parcubacteria group bacterium Gr01-1014_2]